MRRKNDMAACTDQKIRHFACNHRLARLYEWTVKSHLHQAKALLHLSWLPGLAKRARNNHLQSLF
jgi:hypothetical protein